MTFESEYCNFQTRSQNWKCGLQIYGNFISTVYSNCSTHNFHCHLALFIRGRGFKIAYELVNLRCIQLSILNRNPLFQHKISYPYIEICVVYNTLCLVWFSNKTCSICYPPKSRPPPPPPPIHTHINTHPHPHPQVCVVDKFLNGLFSANLSKINYL